jgi:hypothetical protein
MNSILVDIPMNTNEPIDSGGAANSLQHWQRLSAKIAQVGDRIAREIYKKLVASGVDPRSLDNPDGTVDRGSERGSDKRRKRGLGDGPPFFRRIG